MKIGKLLNSNFFGKLFHTTNYSLCKNLKDCESVLDLGCGQFSPLAHCKNIKYSVGVDAFKPYIEKSQSKNIHTEYKLSNILEINYKENSFDAVILIEVIEHLPKEDALKIIKKAEKIAKKRVILTTPNGFIEQRSVDGNDFQKHLSGFSVDELSKLGYKVNGLQGAKFLRYEEHVEDTVSEDITAGIKYYPKKFWFLISALSQIILYFIPKYAFGLFCLKELEGKRDD